MLGAVPPLVLGSASEGPQHDRAKWNVFEQHISGWEPAIGESEDRTDEDGYILPNRRTIALARQILARLRDAGASAPLRVVQDGCGGIDFEWTSGNCAETLAVHAQGDAEFMSFDGTKLKSRKPISIPPARA